MSLDKGKSLVAQILAKLPENLRGIVSPAFEDPQAVDALTLLGTTVVDKTASDTLVAELAKKEEGIRADYDRLNAWYTEKQADLAAYDKIKGGTPPVVPPAAPPAGTPFGFTSQAAMDEYLEKREAERDRGNAMVLAVTTQLASEHYKNFNEVLNVKDLIVHANTNKVSLADAYSVVHAEKITARAKAEDDARIKKLVDEGVAERLKGSAQPFPLRGGSPEISPLDQLTIPTQTADQRAQRYTADSAAARYDELMNARTH